MLAVAMLAVIVTNTRVCLEEDTLGGDIGPLAGRLSSCVGARLDRQQEQVRELISGRLAPTSPPAASP